MNNREKQKVSATAIGTCIMRATSYYEDSSYYKSDDFIAPQMIPAGMRVAVKYKLLRNILKKAIFKVPGIYEYVIARTKFIDAVFNASLENVEQVVLLGAGFDSRAIRFKQQLENAKIFELDSLATQQAKLDKLQKMEVTVPSNVNYIAIDFNRESMAEKLAQANFQKNKTCLFLLEGLTYYLEKEAIESTMQMISDHCAQGSRLVFDYADAAIAKQIMNVDEEGIKRLQRDLAKAGETPDFLMEETIQDYLRKYNFSVIEEALSTELANRYFKQNDFLLNARRFKLVSAVKR